MTNTAQILNVQPIDGVRTAIVDCCFCPNTHRVPWPDDQPGWYRADCIAARYWVTPAAAPPASIAARRAAIASITLDEGEPPMTDPVAAFRERNAGKTLTVRFEPGPVETIDGVPQGVAPETTMTFTVDDDGTVLPVWEGDEPPEGV